MNEAQAAIPLGSVLWQGVDPDPAIVQVWI